MQRMTMSRSVTTPTRRSPSVIGMNPASACFMSCATRLSESSGRAVLIVLAMASWTFIGSLLDADDSQHGRLPIADTSCRIASRLRGRNAELNSADETAGVEHAVGVELLLQALHEREIASGGAP